MGYKADLFVMAREEQLVPGVVESIGNGVVADPSVVGVQSPGLPNVQRSLSWVHLAARYPGRIRVWRGCVEAYKRLADYAANRGVRVAFEPLGASLMNLSTTVCTIEIALQLLHEVNHPNLGLCADAYNLWESNALDQVSMCGDKLFLCISQTGSGREASMTAVYREKERSRFRAFCNT